MSPPHFETFEQFWPYYLQEHSSGLNRRLHQVGTTAAVATLAAAAVLRRPSIVPLALVAGYGPAWVGHFIIERNRPATFTYPAWSLLGDFRMNFMMWNGTLDDEMRRLGLTAASGPQVSDIAG
jgi:hypothetical protein